MTETINKTDELENKVQTLESDIKGFHRSFKTIFFFLGFLACLGIGGTYGIYQINRFVKIAKESKDKAVEAQVKTDSTAKEANTFLKKIKEMDISMTMEELNRAREDYLEIREDYLEILEDLRTEINQYNVNSNNYNTMIKQLTESVDIYIPQQAAAEEREYLRGYIYNIGGDKDTLIDGRNALKQRVWLTFDDSARSILPILAREETLRVQFLYKE